MKQLLFLIGSPRKKGNTAEMVRILNSSINQEKFESNTIFLYNYEFKPCIDCRACKKNDLVCTVKDDMQNLYPELDKADIIIFGTPIYWFGPSAQMKLLIDRLRPYYGNKRLGGKRGAVLLPAGVGKSDCDLTTGQFNRIFNALEIGFIDTVTAKAFDIGDLEKDTEAIQNLKTLADRINQL